MNKSLLTNSIASFLVVLGLAIDGVWAEPILLTGLFALAGSVTNSLAIHMLFEKVPGLYGSGVISARFNDFKQGIHHLVMQQFFSAENVDRFVNDLPIDNAAHSLEFAEIINDTDMTPAFNGLVEVIMASSFGSMLGMFGGAAALDSLREPFANKIKQSLITMTQSDSFQASVTEKLTSQSLNNELHQQIEQIVSARLDELTPQMVKEIIQTMIRQHLGWLVVWGGVFGGLIGLLASQLPIAI